MIGGGQQRGTYSPNGAGTSILLLSHSYPLLPSSMASGSVLHALYQQHPHHTKKPGALLPPARISPSSLGPGAE
jgi:hypothetical protein